jgi:hypothetical protein
MMIMVGIGDLVQRIGVGQRQVGYSVVEWSRGWVTLCAICTVHEETRSTSFLVWPQNQGLQFVSGLASKPLGRFLGLGLKIGSYSLMIWAPKSPRRFLDLDLKIKRATIYRLRHKTNGRMKTAWGTRGDLTACFVWKEVGLRLPSVA